MSRAGAGRDSATVTLVRKTGIPEWGFRSRGRAKDLKHGRSATVGLVAFRIGPLAQSRSAPGRVTAQMTHTSSAITTIAQNG